MTSGIYKIQNVINGKFYIGSAVNFSKRWVLHVSNLNKGIHHSRHLQSAWLKYGADVFDFLVIEECETQKLIEREQYYLDTLKPQYNICKVVGSRLGVKHSDKARAKISSAHKGKILSAEHRAKMKARNISEETRAKIGMARKGKKHTAESRAKISAAIRNMSDETRAKRSAAGKGRTFSAESREKISTTLKEWWAKKKMISQDAEMEKK